METCSSWRLYGYDDTHRRVCPMRLPLREAVRVLEAPVELGFLGLTDSSALMHLCPPVGHAVSRASWRRLTRLINGGVR